MNLKLLQNKNFLLNTVDDGRAGGLSIEGTQAAQDAGITSKVLDDVVFKNLIEANPTLAPLYTMVSDKAAIVPIKQMTFKIPTMYEQGVKTTISQAIAAKTGATAVVNIGNAGINMFAVNDVVQISDPTNPIYGYNGTTHTKQLLTGLVVAIDYNTNQNMTVQLINGYKATPDSAMDWHDEIPVDTPIYSCTRAETEKAAQTSESVSNIVTVDQYMQKLMFTSSVTDLYEKADKKIDYSYALKTRKEMRKYSQRAEYAFLFGVGGVVNETGKSPRQTMWGVESMVGSDVQMPADFKEIDLINNVVIPYFTGNDGSKKRFVFGGSGATGKIMTAIYNANQKYIDARASVEVVGGLTFRKMLVGDFELNFFTHYLFDQFGRKNRALFLDMNNVMKAVFEPFARYTMDGKRTLVFAGQATSAWEVSSAMAVNKDTHMCVDFL